MSTHGTLIDDVAAGRAPGLVPLSVGQFHRMREAGILSDGEPVELIEGMLVRKDRGSAGGEDVVHGPRHALVVARLQGLAARIEGLGGHVRSQLPVTLSARDEPEPDLAVVKGPPEAYLGRHPGPEDVLAIVEVADSSVDFDRTSKQRLYSAAGIATYWIVNIPEDRIEVFDAPRRDERRYSNRQDVNREETGRLVLPAGALEVTAAAILPPR
jgi:Uma2 family endonuclease